MKNEILELMKAQLAHIASELTFENRKEMEEQISRVFTILESSATMLEAPTESVVAEPVAEYTTTPAAPSDEPTLPFEEELSEPEADEDPIPEEAPEPLSEEVTAPVADRFERKIKGGVLAETSVFVPEKVVRELDLQHGDKVYATKATVQPESGPPHYNFEVAERTGTDRSPDNIFEIEMGVVKMRMNDTYYIDRTVNADQIIFEGRPLTLEISAEDVRIFNLKEDDIVNAAFYKSNIFLRIRWKYQTENYVRDSQPSKPSSFYKKKDSPGKRELEQVFEGKTICAMGYVPGHPNYQEEVEARGGTFLGLSGKESEATLASTILKSDALVMNLGHVGHGGTQWAVPFCKENGIPYGSINSFGRSAFVDEAIKLLNS